MGSLWRCDVTTICLRLCRCFPYVWNFLHHPPPLKKKGGLFCAQIPVLLDGLSDSWLCLAPSQTRSYHGKTEVHKSRLSENLFNCSHSACMSLFCLEDLGKKSSNLSNRKDGNWPLTTLWLTDEIKPISARVWTHLPSQAAGLFKCFFFFFFCKVTWRCLSRLSKWAELSGCCFGER